MGMSASVTLVPRGTLFWLYAQAITTDINNILCQHTFTVTSLLDLAGELKIAFTTILLLIYFGF